MSRRAVVGLLALVGPSASAQDPCEVSVGTVGALTEALATAQDAATVCLLPGRYELTGPLVLDRPVTLRGPMAGVDPRSTAGTR